MCSHDLRSYNPAPLDPVAPSPPTGLPRTADGFRIERELGRGGMGVVYLAREVRSGRELALKVLPANLCESEEAFGRFQREAVLAASISDSRCVFVYGAHQFEGSPAIAMELVRGATLEQVIKKGEPILVRQAVRWTIELLEGLDAAHHAGVLHRDVKPSNCFVTEDGHVKIGDFGLSRSLDTDVHLTQSGAFLGSPLYAAPEQIKGRKVDERSDMYSAAATLYALLTGKAPYSGTNLGEVLSRILSEPPPRPRTLRPEIPRGLEKVLLRAMQREPGDRFDDLAAFREALHPYSVEAQTGTLARRFAAHLVDTFVVGFSSSIVVALIGVIGGIDIQIGADGSAPRLGAFAYLSLLESFLYFALFEGLAGATPGKWIAGLRVVDAKKLERSLTGAAVRALLFTLPLTAATATLGAIGNGSTPGVNVRFASLVSFLPYAVRIAYFLTARRRNGLRGVHEFASGTRVVQRALPFPLPQRTKLRIEHALQPVTGLPAAIAGYEVRGQVGETAYGRLLEAEDPVLSRRVWICACEKAALEIDPARRQAARRGRLHWLGSIEQDGLRAEVFEAPGGAALEAWIRAHKALEWPVARQILAGLAEELESTERESPGQRFAPGQLWVDRWGNVRLLDATLDATAAATLSAVELLGRTAALFVPPGGTLPRSLPGGAEAVYRRLLGHEQAFANAAEARSALGSIEGGSGLISRKLRALQVSVAGGALVFVALIMVASVMVVGVLNEELQRGEVYIKDLATGRSSVTGATLDEEDLHARQVAVCQMLALPGGKQFELDLSESERAIVAEARRAVPKLGTEEMKAAQLRLESTHSRPEGGFPASLANPHSSERHVLNKLAIGWLVLTLLGGLLLRGGLTFKLFGMILRDGQGRRAGPLRCALRSLATWSPLALVLLPSGELWLAWSIVGAAFVLLGVGAAYAIWRPARSLPDMLAGTWVAPR